MPRGLHPGNKPPDVRVIVSGVKIIPSRFGIIVVSSVPERVDVRYVIRVVGHIVPAAVRYAYMLTPCVVLVLRHKRSRRVADAHNVPLKVLVVPVLRPVVLKPFHAAGGIVYVVLCTRRGCPPSGFLIFKAVTYLKKLNPGRQTSPPIYHSAYQKVS